MDMKWLKIIQNLLIAIFVILLTSGLFAWPQWIFYWLWGLGYFLFVWRVVILYRLELPDMWWKLHRAVATLIVPIMTLLISYVVYLNLVER